MSEVICRRILLKISGEALMGDGNFGIDPAVIARVAGDIKELVLNGIQVGLVIGGGNIFRGEGLAKAGIDRVSGDHMGMLATVMNALAMQNALLKIDVPARTMSAIPMEQVCETYVRRQAVEYLNRGEVVLFAAGTGNPFFTTDSAASLRAVEVNADLMIKATKVDGVYSADPVKDSSAVFYPRISYDRALAEGLKVMDATAIVLCRDNNMPLRIMNINTPGALMRLVKGDDIGSLVESGE
ncbi:MAG: UMP kinase [Sedimenticola sp.]|uniref:Uridylate kinase n=1 Tax=Sedimenticola thiotaurini TaxID=1543721 RepID=A0A558CRD4_9GAMM|nr:UMP kinase [Sedimenticola sp.]MCW8949423.1 UMP kinase [Sedimenticola sp.]MCW8977039.1 UMP kinase [Sedimenticola sp.]TVT51339.1 MAG: UMP kinase [Sedimenticola thiotaurini]